MNITNLLGNAGVVRYLKNTSWLVFEKILRIIISLFVGVWTTRYLGAEQFGLFSYVQSLVGLFASISSLGLDNIVAREFVKGHLKSTELICTAFWLKIFGSLATVGMLAVFATFASVDRSTSILIFIIGSSVVFQAFGVVDIFFQAKVLSRYVVLANIISLTLASLVKIGLIIANAPLVAFAYAILFENLLLAVWLSYFYYIYNNGSFRHRWDFLHRKFFNLKTAVHLIKESWPLIFGSIAASIYMQIDQIMIKEMLGNKAVAYYSIAVRFSDIWFFITVVITKSLYPAIVSAKERSEELYLARVLAQYDLLVKLALVIAATMFILAGPLVSILYGSEFFESIEILKVYIWSIVFVYLSNGSWAYYINEKLQMIASLRLIVGAAINVILNLFLIPVYGLKGAAIATIVSYAISSYFINYFYIATRNNFKLQTKALFGFFSFKVLKDALKDR